MDLREIAVRGLKARGPGIDATFYLAGAMHPLLRQAHGVGPRDQYEIGIVVPFQGMEMANFDPIYQ